VWQENKHN